MRGAELIDRRFAGWLFNPGFQFSWSDTVHISDLEAADTILSDLEHSRPVNLVIAKQCFLIRKIVLPRKARSRINEILQLNIDNAFPSSSKQLTWSARIVRRTPHELIVEQWVLKSRYIQDLLNVAHTENIEIRSIFAQDANDPIIDHRWRTDRPRILWWLVTVVSVLLALLFSTYSDLQKLNSLGGKTEILDANLDQVRTELVSVRGNLENLENEEKEFSEILTELEVGRSRLKFIANLTDALPDSVWLSELRIRKSSAEVIGFSKLSLPKLQMVLQGVSGVRSANILMPVSVDRRTGYFRFQFELKLHGSGAIK
ncbi:MAG: hypothetical protein ABJP33_05965 [Pseudoruegeria sp.]